MLLSPYRHTTPQMPFSKTRRTMVLLSRRSRNASSLLHWRFHRCFLRTFKHDKCDWVLRAGQHTLWRAEWAVPQVNPGRVTLCVSGQAGDRTYQSACMFVTVDNSLPLFGACLIAIAQKNVTDGVVMCQGNRPLPLPPQRLPLRTCLAQRLIRIQIQIQPCPLVSFSELCKMSYLMHW